MNFKYLFALVLLVCLVTVLVVGFAPWNRPAAADGPQATPTPLPFDLHTPTLRGLTDPAVSGQETVRSQATSTTTIDTPLNCRFGYNIARRPITAYDPDELARLGAGWFTKWSVDPDPQTVNGIEMVQVVRLHQTKDGPDYNDIYVEPYTYTIQSPSGATLAESLAKLEQIAADNPDMLWLVGNEIERRDWPDGKQDEISPELYALAYYQIYHAIKHGDPTARVAIGGVIQATPLRLTYLDRIWDEYQRLYNRRMPVDVWNIHAFVLREKHYVPGCTDCWGADIPAGMPYYTGELYNVSDHRDFAIAREHILAFRQWMKEKGEQNKPLIISEYGVLIPPQQQYPMFTAENVRDFYMYPSFDMLLNEKDPELGYPADDYRLIQRVAWFSLDSDARSTGGNSQDYIFNGWLMNSGLENRPMGLSELGEYWEAYVSDPDLAPLEVDLLPVRAWTAPGAGQASSSGVATVTLQVEIANSGSIATSDPFLVEVYDENGSLLSTQTVDFLKGCGDKTVISVPWPNLELGVHLARILVDPQDEITDEADEGNNKLVASVMVSTERLYLPLLQR